jgi:hypothetical protein
MEYLRKPSLSEAWVNTVRMWKWISEAIKAKKYDELSSCELEAMIVDLKNEWLRTNYPIQRKILHNCLMCHFGTFDKYDPPGTKCKDWSPDQNCDLCPLRVASGELSWRCFEDRHHYAREPLEFYNEVLRLYSLYRKPEVLDCGLTHCIHYDGCMTMEDRECNSCDLKKEFFEPTEVWLNDNQI